MSLPPLSQSHLESCVCSYVTLFLLSVYDRCFTSLCYTADGKCILAGGRSKFVCIYHVDQQVGTLHHLRLFVGKSVNGMKTRAYCKGYLPE